ncbi:MAG: glutamate 5-kinase [Proteobacteria bacterium]|nr:glutamate 5-kinase [Pseudomonadota bacterium]
MSSLPRRIIVKVGTALVTRADGKLALGRLGALAEQLHELREAKVEVVLVSSGAVGLGAERLGFERRPTKIVDRQACAAAGQGALIALYDGLLRRLGHTAAQVLLTEDDFLHREQYLNVHATLERLLAVGAIPVINENDTVSTAEIALRTGEVFGDNDRLSALVAAGVDADLLILLTDVDAVYTKPPGEPGAERIAVYEDDSDVQIGSLSAGGRGGMGSKIVAAQIAARCGTKVVIASGRDPSIVRRLVAGSTEGTHFHARVAGSKRQRWMAFATTPAGTLTINAGAREALTRRNASLLPIGVTAVTGTFPAGAVVAVVDPEGKPVARGICAKSAADCAELVGAIGQKPLVHRNDVVLLGAK